MVYDSSYDYKFISEYEFNEKYLLSKTDGSRYTKCILSSYEVEEIISSGNNFDSDYIEKYYYKINDRCFIKYKSNIKFRNDNEEIKKFLENLH